MAAINGRVPKGIFSQGKRVGGIAKNGAQVYKFPEKRYALRSTGYQWIDLGIPIGLEYKPIRIVQKVKYSNKGTDYNIEGKTSTNRIYLGLGSNSTHWYIGAGAQQPLIADNTIDFDTWYKMDYELTLGKRAILKINDVEKYNGAFTWATSGIVDGSIHLFAVANNTSVANKSYQLKEFVQIYIEDELYLDMVAVPEGNTDYSDIPAPSNCMWDKVNKRYFLNTGTRPFEIIEIT